MFRVYAEVDAKDFYCGTHAIHGWMYSIIRECKLRKQDSQEMFREILSRRYEAGRLGVSDLFQFLCHLIESSYDCWRMADYVRRVRAVANARRKIDYHLRKYVGMLRQWHLKDGPHD